MIELKSTANDACQLLKLLKALRTEVYQEGQDIYCDWKESIQRRAFLISGLNLAYYLALRRRDLRELQLALMPWGLSSLGRSEARVLANLDAVIATLSAVCEGHPGEYPTHRAYFRGQRLLDHHTRSALGMPSPHRRVQIMVTLPSEAATDYQFIRTLLARGMDCARLNCAHDSAGVWQKMIANIRQAEGETGRQCKVMMDLGGPKIRIEGVGFADTHRFTVGEKVLLTRLEPQTSATYPFQISCGVPEVIDQIKLGDSVWIDDGKIGTEVEAIVPEGLLLRITQARPKGERIRAEKGINFPDSELQLTPLTEKDREDLAFAVHYADIVGYSFVQDPSDIALLQQELGKAANGDRRAKKLAIIAKIETPRAVRNLPALIVQAAGQQPFGVMIARGDLAVEIGYERMAEIQEEILWVCEAAHVPVIWATQVLENFVKKGIPSRAEMTDAAMSERADYVMLNKGPYITEAVSVLDDVLTRMQAHQFKKTPQLRALRSWEWMYDR